MRSLSGSPRATSVRRLLFGLAASVVLVATGAACSPDADTSLPKGPTNSAHPEEATEPVASDESARMLAYCDVARGADARIGAELAEFDPNSVTPAQLEQLFDVAVTAAAETSDAAPEGLVEELKLLSDRWTEQQTNFADVGYVFSDAPPEVMELAGEEREAFDTVARFNTDRCSLDQHEEDISGAEHDHTDHDHGAN